MANSYQPWLQELELGSSSQRFERCTSEAPNLEAISQRMKWKYIGYVGTDMFSASSFRGARTVIHYTGLLNNKGCSECEL